MGLFDRFRKRKDSPEAAHPELPAPATIETFDPADGVGDLRFEDGSTLRFGRTACGAFDPVPGAAVRVLEAAPRPYGGVRATRLELAEGARDEHDALLEARDRELGVEPDQGDAAAAAMMLGTVSVLFDQRVPRDRASIRTFLAQTGVLNDTVRLEYTPSPVLVVGDRRMQIFTGGELPLGSLDRRHVGPDTDLGGGFLSLSTGLASIDEAAPLMLGPGPDPWATGGPMRLLTSVIATLAQHGRFVVLHRAGHVVYDAGEWLRRVDDPMDPSCVPFTGWIDVGFTPDRNRLATWGSNVAMRPDVQVAVTDPESEAEYQVAHDALMLGAYVSARDNRILAHGDAVYVPPGLGVGALPLDGGRDARTVDASCAKYVAKDGDDGVVLHLASEGESPDAVWSRVAGGSDEPFGYFPYRALLTTRLGESGAGWQQIARLDFFEVPDPIPPFEVLVLDRGGDFALVTCGLGRVPQAGGDPDDDNVHVELMVAVPQHGPAVARALAEVAASLHGKGPGAPPWCPNDVVHLGDPVGPSDSYVLAFAGKVPLSDDGPVTLLVPAALTPGELESLRAAASRGDWVADHAGRPDVAARWAPH